MQQKKHTNWNKMAPVKWWIASKKLDRNFYANSFKISKVKISQFITSHKYVSFYHILHLKGKSHLVASNI